tara:strand:- start:676 stop:1137 length:462 start_codon:yes stop_codon:yes gene_type:complete
LKKNHHKNRKKRKKRKRKYKNNRNRHHPNPRSRIKYDLTRLLKEYFDESIDSRGKIKKKFLEKIYITLTKNIYLHEAWHTLFDNRFAWEAIKRVEIWFSNDDVGLESYLSEKQLKAWEILFGLDADKKEVIKIIKCSWAPAYPPISKVLKKIQ